MKKVKIYSQTSAFTLVELIFVIIVMGILSTAAVMKMPDNSIYNDVDFITSKIMQKQIQAMNYDHQDFSDSSWRDNFYENSCIDTSKLKFNENSSKEQRKYHIKSKIQSAKICFDSLGRPYKNNYKLNNFLKTPMLIKIEYKNKTKTVKIMPYSGSVMVEN